MAAPMRRVLAIAAISGFCVFAAAGCAKIEARDLVRQGNAAYAAGRYEEALEKYNLAIEKEPDGVKVFWNRACAAESLVLSLRDSTNEAQLASRKKWADMALSDFREWYERLEVKEESDATQLAEHRLAVMQADNRCDDLLAHWMEQHKLRPQEESLYSVIARTHEEVCGQPDRAEEWLVKRTEDFPQSEKAWYTLAVRRFQPLFPDSASGLPYNDSLPPEQRQKAAEEVIRLAQKATEIRGDYRDPYQWRAMAYTQRHFARVYDEASTDPVDRRMALLAREDLMLAWREAKAVCDLDDLPLCAVELDIKDLPAKRAEIAADPNVAKALVNLSGKVVAESVVRDDAASVNGLRVFKLQLKGEAPKAAAPPKNGTKPPKGAPPTPVEEPQPILVDVVLTFPAMDPAALEAGAEDPAVAEFERWKEGKSLTVSGHFEGESFVGSPVVFAACCPPPPFSEAEYAAERQQVKELEAQIAAREAEEAAAAAAAAANGKGGKGGR